MNDTPSEVRRRIETFRQLHADGCFVMPNPWDAGTAFALERMGFPALATTSAGLGFALGLPDDVGSIPLDRVLEHLQEMVAATPLPIHADFQEGYATEPRGVADHVLRCAATGVAGLSIEDATGDAATPLFARDLAVERIRAAREALDSSTDPPHLTARCEAWLVGDPDPFRTAVDRLAAYAEAGADCLYAPGVRDEQEIRRIVSAVAPKPVNVLASGPDPGLAVTRLAGLGVRRISVGSALARVAWGAFLKAASSIAQTGRFDGLDGAAPFSELNAMFESGPRST